MYVVMCVRVKCIKVAHNDSVQLNFPLGKPWLCLHQLVLRRTPAIGLTLVNILVQDGTP